MSHITFTRAHQPNLLDYIDEDIRNGLDIAFEGVNTQDRQYIREAIEDEDGEGEMLDEYTHFGQNKHENTFRGLDIGIEEEIGIKDVSKGVSERTEKEYKRLQTLFIKFLRGRGKPLKDESEVFNETPDKAIPALIVLWIMDSCDVIKADKTPRDAAHPPSSYTWAQKMRSAMTYTYGYQHGLGNLPFHLDPATQKWVGNPSISNIISNYMIALKRRKVQAGEKTISSRAFSVELLKKVFDFNNSHQALLGPDVYATGRGSKNKENPSWAGSRHRTQLNLLYIIAFRLLLRIDEALHLRWTDITLPAVMNPNNAKITITLSFRKNAQCGDIEPFVIYMEPEEDIYLCPVRALANWVMVYKESQIPKEGFVFRPINARDQVGRDPSEPLKYGKFIDSLRMNLMDVHTDPVAYGTHSFRRGGCQFYHLEWRWPVGKICDFGGWSEVLESSNVFRYLYSVVDKRGERRDEYLNRQPKKGRKCTACGRECDCR